MTESGGPGQRTVSVALATYNGERFLSEQLESVSRQTLPPHELVVCDDRSTDSTVEIVAEFERVSPFPVRLHVNEARLGFADNFLGAAARCSGELVAFCDQDDVWHERKLERCVEALEPGVVLVVHNNTVADERLQPTGQVFPGIRRRAVAAPLTSDKWFHMPGMAMLFDAELLRIADWRLRPRSHLAEEELVYHDEWIHVLAQVWGRIAFVPDELALYRQHGENVAGAPRRVSGGRAREWLTTGFHFYRARGLQAREWAELFERLARSETDPDRMLAYERGYAFFERLARALALRAALYEQEGRAGRSAALARAVVGGGYGSRRRGGSGLRGLARDTVMLTLGRGG